MVYVIIVAVFELGLFTWVMGYLCRGYQSPRNATEGWGWEIPATAVIVDEHDWNFYIVDEPDGSELFWLGLGDAGTEFLNVSFIKLKEFSTADWLQEEFSLPERRSESDFNQRQKQQSGPVCPCSAHPRLVRARNAQR
jgi:hypothetical protein